VAVDTVYHTIIAFATNIHCDKKYRGVRWNTNYYLYGVSSDVQFGQLVMHVLVPVHIW